MFFGPTLLGSCMPRSQSAAAEAANRQRNTANNEGVPIPVVFGSAFVDGPTVFWIGHEGMQPPQPDTAGSGGGGGSRPRVSCANFSGGCSIMHPGEMSSTN